jgi:hypothetical protein
MHTRAQSSKERGPIFWARLVAGRLAHTRNTQHKRNRAKLELELAGLGAHSSKQCGVLFDDRSNGRRVVLYPIVILEQVERHKQKHKPYLARCKMQRRRMSQSYLRASAQAQDQIAASQASHMEASVGGRRRRPVGARVSPLQEEREYRGTGGVS